MGPMDPEASLKLQSELLSGENILWAGKPNPNVIFHSDDWYLIPFSLLWGGFAIFWEAEVLGYWGHPRGTPSTFMALWGIPFVVIGQYMIWGRFLYDAWLKRRNLLRIDQPTCLDLSGSVEAENELNSPRNNSLHRARGLVHRDAVVRAKVPNSRITQATETEHQPLQFRRRAGLCRHRRRGLGVSSGSRSDGKGHTEAVDGWPLALP